MAKTRVKIEKYIPGGLIFLYLLLFPFGQLVRQSVFIFGFNIPIHPADLVVGLALLYFLVGGLKQPRITKNINGFLAAGAFSLLISLTFFESLEVFSGFLYLLRIFAYVGFFIVVWNYAKNKGYKLTLLHSLILVAVVIAIFGWIQLLWLPDLTSLKFLGWDDHKYRLVSTFLDPGFTGIILVLGFLAAISKYLKEHNKFTLVLSVILVLTVIFTYSRASYLALIGGLMVSLYLVKRNVKGIIAIIIAVFLLAFPFFPRNLSEGTQLERTHSIYAKYGNYTQTLEIIRESPLFGVGFNNMCKARQEYLGDVTGESHSCSGSDSSLLFVFATTGIVGLMIFLYAGRVMFSSAGRDVYGIAFISSLVALLIHSLFLNSLFYPWVMGWMGILLAISIKNQGEK